MFMFFVIMDENTVVYCIIDEKFSYGSYKNRVSITSKIDSLNLKCDNEYLSTLFCNFNSSGKSALLHKTAKMVKGWRMERLTLHINTDRKQLFQKRATNHNTARSVLRSAISCFAFALSWCHIGSTKFRTIFSKFLVIAYSTFMSSVSSWK